MMPSVSGFTYVRNGFTYGYPFIPAIQSILPLVDELIVVVGDSTDGTREAIVALHEPKIKIIDTIWDDQLRKNGKIFATQSNIGLAACKGDWALHIQADEVLHEESYPAIREAILAAEQSSEVEGLLFPFYHFWGDFKHIRNTRRIHPVEIRAFKNKAGIYSYKDSQGFRKYSSVAEYNNDDMGIKLKVRKIHVPVYHYSYARHPYLMKKKDNYFHRFWHDDEWLKNIPQEDLFDFNKVDKLTPFTGTHPVYMADTIAAQNWQFTYDPTQSNMTCKDKLMFTLNKITGKRLFEFENYKLVK
jgi:glycosyltransferase involved in cell wall biosynthesis